MIDLHLHFDGSLSIGTLQELAEMSNIELSKSEIISSCVAPINCPSLNEYLRCFELPLRLLQDKQTIYHGMQALLVDDKLKDIEYAEIRFAPQLHTCGTMSQEEVIKTTIAAIEDSSQSAKFKLLLCCMRGADKSVNSRTIELANDYKGTVVGVDLAGAEAIYPTSDYADLFKMASHYGLNITVHAGEASGWESVAQAVDMGAKRIGHGLAIVHNDNLIKLIKRSKIGIELCPKSNLDTKAIENIRDYPIRRMLDEGMLVTVNTDNLTVSSTSMFNEYSLLKELKLINDSDIALLRDNAKKVAFC